MFFHIVVMRLAPDADADFHARVAGYVARVRSELDYVRTYDFGRNGADRGHGYDWAVIGTFDSGADHDRYQVSPVHLEMKAFMVPHIAELVVCDLDTAAYPDGALHGAR